MLDWGWRPDDAAIREAVERDLSEFTLPKDRELAALLPSPAVSPDHYDIVDSLFGGKGEFPLYPISASFHACAASAVAAAIELTYARVNGKRPPFQPSTRFLYYTGRYLQLRERMNSGASIFATLRAAQVMGFCDEKLFRINEGDMNEAPDSKLYETAADCGVVRFFRLPRSSDLFKRVLSNGYPILFGMYVTREFIKSRDVRRFDTPDASIVDRHCLLAVGYSDEKGCIIARDSISPQRGDHGYVEIASRYFMNARFTDDFWFIADVQFERNRALDDVRDKYVEKATELRRAVAAARAEVTAIEPITTDTVLPPIAQRVNERARSRN